MYANRTIDKILEDIRYRRDPYSEVVHHNEPQLPILNDNAIKKIIELLTDGDNYLYTAVLLVYYILHYSHNQWKL